MSKAHQHHPLVIVLTMRLPDALASDQALEQRHRRICDERPENQYREPQRPDVVAPSDDAERTSKESERNRADVTQKKARRMQVVQQEGSRGGGKRQAHGGEGGLARKPGSRRVSAKANQCHPASKPI